MNHQHLVAKVNEIYYDVTSQTYAEEHPEIFIHEANRWRRIAKEHLAKEHPITILDLGTGTGFVPLTIAPFLKRQDTFICSDISSEMLRTCQNEIAKRQFDCKFKFLRLKQGLALGITESVDFITMNSVLHHVADIGKLCSLISDTMAENGKLIIAHEPNRKFRDHPFLWKNYTLLHRLNNLPTTILGRLGIAKGSVNRKPHSGDEDVQSSENVIYNVNRRLLEEGLIKNPLTGDEIISLVEIHDFHSPSVDGLHKKPGFNLWQLLERELSNFELVYCETYNHLSNLTTKNWFTRVYARLLQAIFPRKGATFLCMLTMTSNRSHDSE